MATQKRGRYVGSGLTHSMTKERKDRAKRFLNQRDFERSNIAVLLLFILSSCIKTVAPLTFIHSYLKESSISQRYESIFLRLYM